MLERKTGFVIMKKRLLLPLIGLLAFSLSACGTKGDTGPQGPQGPQGEQGIPGQNGQDGKDGSNGVDGVDGVDGTSLLTGEGAPSSELGKVGDSYINLSNWDFYVKGEQGWGEPAGNIKGSAGDTGDQGVSIISTHIDTNGDLIVELSNGSEINAGHIKDNPTYHTVTFDPNSGTSVASQQVKHLEKVAKPDDPILEGYFLGSWRYGDEDWSFGGNVVTEDMTLVANWLPKLHDLNIASEDTSKGTVSIDGTGYSDETITVTAYAESNYVFKGWYNGYTKISEDPAYTFTMPKEDYSLVAHFFSLDEDRYASRPDISLDGKTMTYGLYPQSQVDSDLESTLDSAKSSLAPDANGWYLYDDTYYAEAGNYWFECEPILWCIFSSNNSGEYTLISKIALDSHCFYHDLNDREIGGETILPNNYQHSDVRSFLINEFYHSAFNLDDSYIKPTAISTNMTDNVFLLTYDEYIHNWNYPRKCEVSDWSKARGINTLDTSYCRYWARTPDSDRRFAKIIYETGGQGALSVNASYLGVRPAITLTLSSSSI